MQTRLHERMIEHGVLFAARHEGKARRIGEHGPGAILSVESKQGACLWELVRREVTRDGREALTQLLPVATVAPVAKRAEPLETMGLTNDGAGAHHLSTLTPFVARSTDVIQPAKGRGECFCLGQGTLAGCLTGAIEIKDHPGVSCSIHQTPGLLLIGVVREWATEHIIEKKRAHSFNGRLGQCCQKAREGRAGGELVTVKESHEGDRKGLEPLVEGFQGGFPADGIAEENREKIDDLVVPETTPRKAYTLADLG